MNLSPKTTVYDYMYNVKYRQTDNIYEQVLFQYLKQTRVNHAVLKVTSLIDFGMPLELFSSLEKYIG